MDTDKGPQTNGAANGAVSVSIDNKSIGEDDTERYPMITDKFQEQRHDKDDIDDPVAIAEASTDMRSLPIDKGWAWMVLLGRYAWLILHVRDHENKKYKSSCQYIHSRQHIYNTLIVIVTVNCGELIQGVRS